MAELVDARDLKSGGESRAGSSPAEGTILEGIMKLSEIINENILYESDHDDYWTNTFRQWREYAEWLESCLEGEGMWADKDKK